jgi:hypothetical protein
MKAIRDRLETFRGFLLMTQGAHSPSYEEVAYIAVAPDGSLARAAAGCSTVATLARAQRERVRKGRSALASDAGKGSRGYTTGTAGIAAAAANPKAL